MPLFSVYSWPSPKVSLWIVSSTKGQHVNEYKGIGLLTVLKVLGGNPGGFLGEPFLCPCESIINQVVKRGDRFIRLQRTRT